MSVSIDNRESEEVPSIPRAHVKRLTNLTIDYDFWRLPMKGWYCLALRSLFRDRVDYEVKPTVAVLRQ